MGGLGGGGFGGGYKKKGKTQSVTGGGGTSRTGGGGSFGGIPATQQQPTPLGGGAGPSRTGGGGLDANAINKLLGGFGGGFKGGGPPSLRRNTAQAQPDVRYGIDQLKDLYSSDMGAGRSIDMLGRKLADAGAGAKGRLAASRTARGVSGTGVDAYDESGVEEGISRDLARGGAEIALGLEGERRGVLKDIIGGGATQAGIMQGDKGLALQQYGQASQNWNQMQLARERAQDRQWQMAMSLLSGSGMF